MKEVFTPTITFSRAELIKWILGDISLVQDYEEEKFPDEEGYIWQVPEKYANVLDEALVINEVKESTLPLFSDDFLQLYLDNYIAQCMSSYGESLNEDEQDDRSIDAAYEVAKLLDFPKYKPDGKETQTSKGTSEGEETPQAPIYKLEREYEPGDDVHFYPTKVNTNYQIGCCMAPPVWTLDEFWEMDIDVENQEHTTVIWWIEGNKWLLKTF